MAKLSGPEVVENIRLVMTALKELTETNTIGGVILTESTFFQVRNLFGNEAKEYRPSNLVFDANREISFVVDGVLFLKGTTPQ